MKLSLNREWTVGDEIGAGGFGRVYAVTSDESQAVAKLVPKDPGADRELLFVHLEDVRNVVPVIDGGETENAWVIVMPHADRSLGDYLEAAPDHRVTVEEAVSILRDITTALADLDGRVVHRDLKPDNLLLLNGAWCLADFGISRYAEATTSVNTQKFALSPPYAAPERWRMEHATGATDMYSLGVIGYELLSGGLPFPGPQVEGYRNQHLHSEPAELQGIPALLASLLDECMYKAPGARPSAANFLARLGRVIQPSQSAGLARLSQANRAEVSRQSALSRQESQSKSVEDTRRELTESAAKALTRIRDSLRDSILDAAPAARHIPWGDGWTIQLNEATLRFSGAVRTSPAAWDLRTPAFDVVCHASISLKIPEDQYQYEGRSHSLWFRDAQTEGEYAWFETAFMVMALRGLGAKLDPFALDPGEDAGSAVGPGLGGFQVAWPFTRLEVGRLEEFIDRWAEWLAAAAGGNLRHPSSMPERTSDGTWRQR